MNRDERLQAIDDQRDSLEIALRLAADPLLRVTIERAISLNQDLEASLRAQPVNA